MQRSPVERSVRAARGRLAWARLVRAVPWWVAAWLLAAVVVIGVDKRWPLGIEPWVWVVAATACGLVSAIVWTLTTRVSRLDAALEVDRRFGLRERLSSTLALTETDRATAAGRALCDDAARAASKLRVGEQFRVRPDRWAWLPLLPAALAFVVALWVPPWSDKPAEATTDPTVRAQIKKHSETLEEQLAERKREAEEKGLRDAEHLFARLEEETRKLQAEGPTKPEEALAKLNDLARDLEKRREQLAGNDALREELNKMQDLGPGPAEKLAQALKQGDFAEAQEQARRLREQLEKGELDPDARKKLAEQLRKLQQQLEAQAEARKQRDRQLAQQEAELERQAAEKRAAGDEAGARQAEEQLEKVRQQRAGLANEMQGEQLAAKLGQCAKCLEAGEGEGQQGQGDAAEQALADLEAQLGGLDGEAAEMEMLDQALGDLQACKGGMCGGQQLADLENAQGGTRAGRGQGHGDGPDNPGDGKFYDSRVKQQPGQGDARIVGTADGPNARGQVEARIRTEVEEVRGAEADPLTGQRLPRELRDHSRSYFDALREGK